MLIDILENSSEEELQGYLAKNEQILVNAFGNPWYYYNLVLPKFRFGSDYISDFVVLTGQSYSYWLYLIELEPATEKIFTRSGVYAKRLNQAILQVSSWEDWIQDNDGYFRKSLCKSIKEKYPDFDENLNSTRRFIINPKIIIGRRNCLSDENNKQRAHVLNKSKIDIVTYDRLVDIERKMLCRFNEA